METEGSRMRWPLGLEAEAEQEEGEKNREDEGLGQGGFQRGTPVPGPAESDHGAPGRWLTLALWGAVTSCPSSAVG